MVSPTSRFNGSRFHLLIFFSLFSYMSHSKANTSFRPRALVLPITQDPLTQQYTTHINKRTPFVPVKLTVDLGGQFLWVACDKGYVSSSYKPVHCDISECNFQGLKPGTTVLSFIPTRPDDRIKRKMLKMAYMYVEGSPNVMACEEISPE
ncbi:hypothetical protein RJ639_009936 [Escallonia herrerae]|uniref:Xylanase inhibitor N-terminal domain-containing protein n=1 Tax=Escallonia herrerae TaxID=1293975 RepID=A0AA88VTE1_9ASTE|nr:hypothetical protein RJ639_009936 [Escallonia herrerae]